MKPFKIPTILFLSTIIASGVVASYWSPTQEKVASASTQTPEDQAKSEIQQKMWDSIDYYKTVKGTFNSISKRGGNTSGEFQVRQGMNPGSYVKAKAPSGAMIEELSDGMSSMKKRNGQVSSAAKIYGSEKGPVTHAAEKKPNKRYASAEGGQTARVYRYDPSGSTVSFITFPQADAFWLEDYSKWSIVGEESFLGRTAVVISGEMPEDMKVKHNAETFKYWVDKETGIMLKCHEYSKQGEVMEGHEVTSIKVNGGDYDEKLSHVPKEEVEKYEAKQKGMEKQHSSENGKK